MKVALVCDTMSAYGGAERVIEHILDLYPAADLFTVLDAVPAGQRGFLGGKPIRSTFLQKLPQVARYYRKLLHLWPMAVEQLDVMACDLVISMHHSIAYGVLTRPGQVHVSCVFSPARYAWDLQHEYLREARLDRGLMNLRRWPAAAAALSLAGSLACTAALAGREPDSLPLSLVDTGRFVALFVAGILVAERAGLVRRAVGRWSAGATGLAWVAALSLMLAPGPSMTDYYDFIWGAGAIGLLLLTVGSARADRHLSARPLLWLGKVSYSLYLIHVPLLIACVQLLHGRVPLPLILAGAAALSLLCAEAMHRLVEAPSMRLGRHLYGPAVRSPAQAGP